MIHVGLIFFSIYLLIMVILDIAMLISMINTGDERKQMIVWKASSFTLLATVGSLILGIAENIIKVEAMSVNPFTTVTAAATIYFMALLYYRKKHGG